MNGVESDATIQYDALPWGGAHLCVCQQAGLLLHGKLQGGAALRVITQGLEGNAAPPQAVRAVAPHQRPEEADRVVRRCRPAPVATHLDQHRPLHQQWLRDTLEGCEYILSAVGSL